jgi:anti-anti-sigma factor
MSGEVDLDVVGATAGQRQAREELMRGVEVVDASQVTFIDSAGVHLLIVGATAARDRGSTLRLRRPADLVLALVQVMGLGHLFDVDLDDTTTSTWTSPKTT